MHRPIISSNSSDRRWTPVALTPRRLSRNQRKSKLETRLSSSNGARLLTSLVFLPVRQHIDRACAKKCFSSNLRTCFGFQGLLSAYKVSQIYKILRGISLGVLRASAIFRISFQKGALLMTLPTQTRPFAIIPSLVDLERQSISRPIFLP